MKDWFDEDGRTADSLIQEVKCLLGSDNPLQFSDSYQWLYNGAAKGQDRQDIMGVFYAVIHTYAQRPDLLRLVLKKYLDEVLQLKRIRLVSQCDSINQCSYALDDAKSDVEYRRGRYTLTLSLFRDYSVSFFFGFSNLGWPNISEKKEHYLRESLDLSNPLQSNIRSRQIGGSLYSLYGTSPSPEVLRLCHAAGSNRDMYSVVRDLCTDSAFSSQLPAFVKLHDKLAQSSLSDDDRLRLLTYISYVYVGGANKVFPQDPNGNYALRMNTMRAGKPMRPEIGKLEEIVAYSRKHPPRRTLSAEDIIDAACVDIEGCRVLAKLGEGGYKSVYLCECDELPDSRFALVISDLGKIQASTKAQYYLNKLGRTALENCRNEAGKLSNFNLLRNENIPLLLSFPQYREADGVYWWIEELVEETLADVMDDKPKSERMVAKVIRHISNALAGASQLGYFHGDLSPQNVGISHGKDASGNITHVIKVLDWGLCPTIPCDPYQTDVRDFLGYRLTRAPEVFEGYVPTEKADVWSLGVIAYRIMTGHYPFMWSFQGTRNEWRVLPMEQKEVYEKELKEKVFSFCHDPTTLLAEIEIRMHESRQIGAIISKCMNPDPEKRPSPQEIHKEVTKTPRGNFLDLGRLGYHIMERPPNHQSDERIG